MIIIKNTQRSVSINLNNVKNTIHKILKLVKYEDFDLGIWFTSDKTIRRYNREYRNKDKATDILSFPFYPNLKPPQRIRAKTNDQKNLGDLILALAYIQMAAKEKGISFEEYLKILLVHGVCHLLGYDHITDSDYKVMQKKEIEILKKLK